MYDVDSGDVSVVTNKELLFLVGIFIFILVQLYPKNILQKIIEDDNSDYALTMIYLKDLLKHHPNDEMLQLVYLEKKMQVRDVNASIPLALKLSKSSKEYIKEKATLLAFNAELIKYFQIKDKKEKQKLYTHLQKLFSIIFAKKLYDNGIKQWYAHATFVKHDKARYFFIKQLLQKDPTNVKLLRPAYFLALKFGEKKQAKAYLQKLLQYDKKKLEQWVMEAYYALVYYKKYNEAQKILEAHANESKKIKKLLASFYLMRSLYKQASKTYLDLSYRAKNKKDRKKYLKKAIQSLQAGNLLKEAALLAHKYETYYINDRDMRSFILKIYLASGKLEWADAYAKRILYNSYQGIK